MLVSPPTPEEFVVPPLQIFSILHVQGGPHLRSNLEVSEYLSPAPAQCRGCQKAACVVVYFLCLLPSQKNATEPCIL